MTTNTCSTVSIENLEELLSTANNALLECDLLGDQCENIVAEINSCADELSENCSHLSESEIAKLEKHINDVTLSLEECDDMRKNAEDTGHRLMHEAEEIARALGIELAMSMTKYGRVLKHVPAM